MFVTLCLVLLVLCLALLVGGIVLVIYRRRKGLLSFIDTLSCVPLYGRIITVQGDEVTSFLNADILSDIATCYYDKYITFDVAAGIVAYYEPHYVALSARSKSIARYCSTVEGSILAFLKAYEHLNEYIRQHNEKYISSILECNKAFFDTCIRYPLDPQQRRAIVSKENTCLVVSSAGSGKTSTIIGRLRYLVERQGVDPKRILLVSFTHKAAAELTARINVKGATSCTFHKLALDIIGSHTGQKPTICETTETLLSDICHALLREGQYGVDVAEYLSEKETLSAAGVSLANNQQRRYEALFPDMDGHPIYVKSRQEQKICFALSSLGVAFRYEEPYEYPVADERHAQYRPDFSIYYSDGGTQKRIYLEHFGVNEHSRVPRWFAEERGITYREANRRYNDGITWKRALHKKYGTVLLTTTSADFHYDEIREKVRTLLMSAHVPLRELSAEELAQKVLPEGSKQEKVFLRLVSTFVELMKSSCRSTEEVVALARAARDKRSVFVLQRLFLPVFEQYNAMLHQRGEIDFTDAILRATAICNNTPRLYDHILVDEFQDLSVDRYRFLLALRHGTPPATLYCVGDDWQSIYRFTGSDIALFNHFEDYFGRSEINKIETTYRFGEPLLAQSSAFILRNPSQVQKTICPFSAETHTTLTFTPYTRKTYCAIVRNLIMSTPANKTILFLGRYTFDDTLLRTRYTPVERREHTLYTIAGRTIEFLTVHKAKGLEADYVILLECNNDRYGFPSLISDDEALQYVLSVQDNYPHSEERRLFYVAITRARCATWVLYDRYAPSPFVVECQPEIPPYTRSKTRVSPYYRNRRYRNKYSTK